MDLQFRDVAIAQWQHYFPQTEMPIAVFYADDLCGAEYAPIPPQSKRGYVCLFAQLAKVHHGVSLAFDAENLGCWGALRNLFGGPYQEDVTVNLLVNIEKFKSDREQTNLLHEINPVAHPTGRYVIFKPLDKLTEADSPAIYCIFAKPDAISALHTLSGFDNTRIDNVIVPFGSGCEQMLTFAFNEAVKENPRAILGGMDTAMRACVKSDVLTFSVAAQMFERMVANMDKSFLTTYIWEPLKSR
ncbi:MAG: DUF169 domain-containing protein [Alistipes sp.]|nr:DUF169 domain-containing protein [Alistipes sp.]